jgi:hypothetical protein
VVEQNDEWLVASPTATSTNHSLEAVLDREKRDNDRE